jgi:hypothetical protein
METVVKLENYRGCLEQLRTQWALGFAGYMPVAVAYRDPAESPELRSAVEDLDKFIDKFIRDHSVGGGKSLLAYLNRFIESLTRPFNPALCRDFLQESTATVKPDQFKIASDARKMQLATKAMIELVEKDPNVSETEKREVLDILWRIEKVSAEKVAKEANGQKKTGPE